MNARVIARYERFKRIIAFRDARKGAFAAGSKAVTEFGLIDSAIVDMEEAEGRQAGGKQVGKGGTTNKAVMLDALRTDMLNIARTARAIAEKESNPGFAEKFRMPDSPGEAALIVAAKLFRDNASASGVSAKFMTYELPADFVAHLEADVAAVEAENKVQDTGLDEQTGGTEAIDVAVSAGLAAADQLDAIMQNKFSRDAETLRAWNSANHTERAPQRAKPTPPAAPAAPK
ncbi:MAG: hypothetical protein RLZZ350_581 [Verrucomicrobiota bacterium]|jgi:hypothetical protein